MSRLILITLLNLMLAGCHTTRLGRSIGFPAQQRSANSNLNLNGHGQPHTAESHVNSTSRTGSDR